MKAYLAVKYHEDKENKELVDSLNKTLEEAGFEVICLVSEEYEKDIEIPAEELMDRTFREIDKCDLTIIDLSEKGVGLGIEAGYAKSENIPVYTIAEKGSEISKTLRGISREVIRYKEPEELKDKFKRLKKEMEKN